MSNCHSVVLSIPHTYLSRKLAPILPDISLSAYNRTYHIYIYDKLSLRTIQPTVHSTLHGGFNTTFRRSRSIIRQRRKIPGFIHRFSTYIKDICERQPDVNEHEAQKSTHKAKAEPEKDH